MINKPKVLENESFFSWAESILDPGYYQKYVNKYPEHLQQEDSQRQPSAYTVKMLVATTWQGGKIGKITPQGKTYCVFTYQDHIHTEGDLHFNKMFQVYTHDNRRNPIMLTMEKGIHDHYIEATALGTSLAYLEQAYRIPPNDKGPISDLLVNGTSVDPYPTE